MDFAGFPRKVRYTPVPSPVFGPLLEQIDDLSEMKCALRVIWMLHEKRGYPRYVSLKEVLADRVLARSLSGSGDDARVEIERALGLAVERGVFAKGSVGSGATKQDVYALNTEVQRRALAEMAGEGREPDDAPEAEAWAGTEQRPNIFGLYEENIGMLSPMIAEELKEAEDLYPQSWIEDAFREAVGHNKRSWRYVAAILERWQQEGRNDGEPVRGPQKSRYY